MRPLNAPGEVRQEIDDVRSVAVFDNDFDSQRDGH